MAFGVKKLVLFDFPNPVNEIAARLVAGMVAILAALVMFSDSYFLLAFLTYGFLARVLTGPKLSPMGLLITKVVVPILGNPNRPVPGPPKRFAQTIGLVISGTALGCSIFLGFDGITTVLLGVLTGFAVLESVFGICAGCFIFGYLMKWGIIPEEICQKCQL
jgi:hypothetical protein